MTTRFPRIRMDLTRMGIGNVQVSTRARTEREHNRRVALFDELVERGQVAVIKALVAKPGTPEYVSWEEVLDHRRRNGGAVGADALVDIDLNKPLFPAIDATLPKMGKKKETRDRYRTSRNALEKKGKDVFGTDPRVRDILTADWSALQGVWGASAADWNHALRMCMTFASRYRGKRSTFAAQVRETLMAAMRAESPRVPDLSVGVFHTIVAEARPDVASVIWLLALTGMRIDEALACDRQHLRPATMQLVVPGTKTDESGGALSFDEEDWPYIDQAVPVRLKYRRLYVLWEKACVAAGAGEFVGTGTFRTRVLPAAPRLKRPGPRYITEEVKRYRGLRLHDLRHFCAQLADESGVSLPAIRAQLRHANIQQTEKYARRRQTRETSRAVSGALRKGGRAAS